MLLTCYYFYTGCHHYYIIAREKKINSIQLILEFEKDKFAIKQKKEKSHPTSEYARSISNNVMISSKDKLLPGYVYYDILSIDRQVLYAGVFPDPLYLKVEFQPKIGSMRSSTITHSKANYAVIIPYYAEAVSIRLKRVTPDMNFEDLGTESLK